MSTGNFSLALLARREELGKGKMDTAHLIKPNLASVMILRYCLFLFRVKGNTLGGKEHRDCDNDSSSCLVNNRVPGSMLSSLPVIRAR